MKTFLKALLIAGLVLGAPVVSLAQPVPSSSGTATAANQTALNTAIGTTGQTACATDTGTCSLVQLLKRDLAAGTTLRGIMGSPFQAGGSIGNTAFGATQSGTWNITNISGTVSLPTGAATSSAQSTANSSLSTIATNTTSIATAANQTTAQTSFTALVAGVGVPAATAWASGDATLISLGKAIAGAAVDTTPAATNQTQVGGSTLQTASNGLNSTGTGLTTSVLSAQVDETSPVTTTENSFSHVRMSPGHMLYSSPISGQDGVDGNTGAASAKTVRVVLANESTAQQGSTGSAVPAKATYLGANSAGNLTGIIQPDASVAISISTATTTQLVALSSGKKIYVGSWNVIAGGTGNFKLVYGTGSSCGTGTTDVTGNYNLVAQAGIATGGGIGAVLVIPASQALCATTSAATQMSGSLAYTQF